MKTILIIEDNLEVRENTADLLELACYKAITAENGRIGVEKAKQLEPDLVISDIMMPELDGYEVLKLLSANKKTAHIPFIFLTAKSEISDMRIGMNLGADDYLTKPFEEHELLDAIASRLKKNDFLKKEFSKNLIGINEFLEEASQYINLNDLIEDINLKKFEKKTPIFREGDPAHSLYFIHRGTLKTSRTTASGKELVTGLYAAGDFVGQLSLFSDHGTYIETATVLEDAEVCGIPKSDFIKLLYENKVVSNKFIQMISNNLIEMQNQLLHMAFGSVRQRTARTLLDLHQKGIIMDKTSTGIGIPREDFAGIIGSATETAIRMLSEFKDEGLITVGTGKKIILLDKNKLKHIANIN